MPRETTTSIGDFFTPLFRGMDSEEIVRANSLKLIKEAVEHARDRGCTEAEVHRACFPSDPPQHADLHSAWHERLPTSDDEADMELGDCLVVIANILYHRRLSADDLRNAAMAKNRRRGDKWDLQPDGTLQHREGTPG